MQTHCQQCGKDDLPLNQQSGLYVRCAIDNKQMEQAILKAAEEADDNLLILLDKAIEHMSEEQANRLLDKVHQVQKEALQDARDWK